MLPCQIDGMRGSHSLSVEGTRDKVELKLDDLWFIHIHDNVTLFQMKTFKKLRFSSPAEVLPSNPPPPPEDSANPTLYRSDKNIEKRYQISSLCFLYLS